MAMDLKGKSAIVTGAGSGICLSFARLLLSKKCNVVFADIALRPEAKEIVSAHSSPSSSSGRAIFQETDVREWTQLERMFQTAISEFGDVDVVCPGAGVYEPSFSSFWHFPGSTLSKDLPSSSRYASIDIDLVHPIRTTQLAISHFLSSSSSTANSVDSAQLNNQPSPKAIVHVSSIAAQVTPIWAPLYNASKHGVSGFVRTLAGLSHPSINIRVTAVAPGLIDTPLWRDNSDKHQMFDEAKDEWITADDVADVMAGLIEEDEISAVVQGEQQRIAIEGGLILEIGKGKIRKVEVFHDEGPWGPGHTLSNRDVLIEEVVGKLVRK